MKPIDLKEAGYREKVFFKSYLAQTGNEGKYKMILDETQYDPEEDQVIMPRGVPIQVTRGPKRSREILAERGQDDRGCGDPSSNSSSRSSEGTSSSRR